MPSLPPTLKRGTVVPGTPFYPYGGGHNAMRLNFSYSTPDTICEGIARLGQLLQD
jgi:DNA-binding transcriptional MocR family regulator